MYAITFIICFLVLAFGNGEIYVDLPRDHIALSELTVYMTKTFIRSRFIGLIIIEMCSHCSAAQIHFHMRLLDYFLMNLKESAKYQLCLGISVKAMWDYNIFVVDSALSFENQKFEFPDTIHERDFYFFIILTKFTTDNEEREAVMLRIFAACRRVRVLYAIIMNEFPDGSIRFFTYELYRPGSCFKVQRLNEYNRYINGSLDHNNLFPKYTPNFQDCALNISAHVLHPLLTFYGDPTNSSHLKNVNRLSGIEGELLKLLSESLNFRINLAIPMEQSSIGAYKNSTGCFADIESGDSQIAIGGFSGSMINRQVFSASATYHQSAFVFVLRTDLEFGPIKQLAFPFNQDVWMTIGCTLLIAICFIKILGCWAVHVRSFVMGSRNYNPTANLVTILLGNLIKVLPGRNFARFLLIAWMLLTLVLRSAYQGQMFDSWRAARRAPLPRSITELIDSRYELIFSHYTDFYPSNMTTIMPNMTHRYQTLESSNKRLTTLSLLDTLAFYNYHNWNVSRLTFLNEPVYYFQLAMYFRKNSFIKSLFEVKMQQLMDAGIISYMARYHVKSEYQNMNSRIVKVSRISNGILMGLYHVYMLLNIYAFLLFCFELLSRKSQKIKSIFDWIHRRPVDI